MKIKKYIIMLNLLIRIDGNKKAKYLEKNKVFHKIGRNFYYHPRKIPTEPWLVSFGDNVVVTANVTFVTHDILAHMFSDMFLDKKFKTHFGNIIIGNNVFIGSNSVIMYNTKIEDNVVISAGSVVHGHIPSNSVIAGNPAKIIGTVDELILKRENSKVPSASDGKKAISKYFWGEE